MSNIIKRMILNFFILILLISCQKNREMTSKYEIQEKNNCIVKMFEGKISILDSNNNKLNIEAGLKLDLDWKVKTEENSIIELLVGTSQTVVVKENSELVISTLFKNQNQENSKLRLKKGTIFIESNKLTIGSSFEVETDSITVGIRGTEFSVSNEDEESKVLVERGEVKIKKNIKVEDLEDIKDKDEKLYKELKESIEDETIVKDNEKFEITEEELNKEKEEIKKSLKNIRERLKRSEKIEADDNDVKNIKNRKRLHRKSNFNKEERNIYLNRKEKRARLNKRVRFNKIERRKKILKKLESNDKTKYNNESSGKILLKEIKFADKVRIDEINCNNEKFSQIIFETANNDIVFNRVRIIYEDKRDLVISKNFNISKESNEKGILKVDNSVGISKIRVTLTSKLNNSPATKIFVYGIK